MSKKFSKLFIVDGSYMLHRCLKVESLWDLKAKDGQRTGGIFGFMRALNSEFMKYDHYPVVTWDQGLSPRRIELYPYYKRHDQRVVEDTARKLSRNQISEDEAKKNLEEFSGEVSFSRVQEAMNEILAAGRKDMFNDPDNYLYQYHRQRSILINLLESFGISSFRYNNWEGDDLITLLKRVTKNSIIITDDKDMIQLISHDTDISRPIQKEYLTYDKYLQDNGFDSEREMIYLKAITGDGSDNIPSVTEGLERKYVLGYERGKVVAKMIHNHKEDKNGYLPELAALGKNYYQGFIDNHYKFERNMGLVDLSLVEDPDYSITTDMIGKILSNKGTANFMNVVKLLGELDINKFDTSGFISKMNFLSSTLTYEECEV